jgi:large subunit ribosomal protein L22
MSKESAEIPRRKESAEIPRRKESAEIPRRKESAEIPRRDSDPDTPVTAKPVRKERAPRKRTTGYSANVPFQRVSATKVRRIADNIRRKPYVEAIALLDVLPHKGARLLRKLIQSAASNALAKNKNLDEEMLYVKELLVDVGPTMKRMWARGRGRADRLLKRSCHISVVVDEIGAKEVVNGSEG